MLHDIAIIGAGPGGISTAIEAKILGFEHILLFEKESETSNTIRKFYKNGKRVDKDYKGQVVDLKGSIGFSDSTKEETLNLFDDLLKKHNISPIFSTAIEKVTQKDGFFEIVTTKNDIYNAKFVVISVGKMGQPNKPDYKIPPSLLRKVAYNINDIQSGESVLVVGGGNSAAEYAIALSETNPTAINHRSHTFTAINEINAKDLENARVNNSLKMVLGLSTTELKDNEGKVEACFDDGSSLIFDKVVYAIGGSVPLDFLKKCGIEIDDNKLPKVTNFESSIKNLFVIGDILYKSGASISNAMNEGFEVASIIHSRKN